MGIPGLVCVLTLYIKYVEECFTSQDFRTPRLRGFSIDDETLLRLFDLASQTGHKIQRKQTKNKITKIYFN